MTILKDTTLCAIVRDEMINPAQLRFSDGVFKSGVRSFVETHASHVDRMIVDDTGSTDGTREELDRLQKEFPNLVVFDRPFDNYANARNVNIRRADTPYVLVVDADEVFKTWALGEIEKRKRFLGKDRKAMKFRLINIRHDGVQDDSLNGNPIRFFLNDESLAFGSLSGKFEDLYLNKKILSYKENVEVADDISFLHFLPGNSQGLANKEKNWYANAVTWRGSPKDVAGHPSWKEPNSFRAKYDI